MVDDRRVCAAVPCRYYKSFSALLLYELTDLIVKRLFGLFTLLTGIINESKVDTAPMMKGFVLEFEFPASTS